MAACIASPDSKCWRRFDHYHDASQVRMHIPKLKGHPPGSFELRRPGRAVRQLIPQHSAPNVRRKPCSASNSISRSQKSSASSRSSGENGVQDGQGQSVESKTSSIQPSLLRSGLLASALTCTGGGGGDGGMFKGFGGDGGGDGSGVNPLAELAAGSEEDE